MNESLWNERWEKNEIGFHEGQVNARLVRYLNYLQLAKNSRIFVPLCGKTVDIAWLLSAGYRVAGAEFSNLAIGQLFAELKIQPKISGLGEVSRNSAKHVDIFVGDVFDVSREILGAVDAIYDRGALVALPHETRRRYTAHLTEVSDNAPQLLITCDYDHEKVKGSPFPVSNEEVEELYGDTYELTLLESAEIPGGLKGICPARANAWLLTGNQ
jgi:thiopurine S-methyltransferase